jgi:cysteine-rich repeat protein
VLFGALLVAACGSSERGEAASVPEQLDAGDTGAPAEDASGPPLESATEDTGAVDAAPDAGADSEPETDAELGDDTGAEPDADPDAGREPDAAIDAEAPPDDAAADGPPEDPVCGDGWRDPATEECDDGSGSSPPDFCSADCRVQEMPVLASATPIPSGSRYLGDGRHPIAAGEAGFLVAFVETAAPIQVLARAFGPNGNALGDALVLDSGPTAISVADPVAAALPGGRYAVAWTYLTQDGFRDIALSIVDPAKGPGPRIRANATILQNQVAPDILWSGQELLVAWEDYSRFDVTGRDIVYRRFDSAGRALAGEQVLARSAVNDLDIALTTRSGGWAAAWQIGELTGSRIGIQAGAKQWSVGPYPWPPAVEVVAITDVGADHLFVAFVIGGLSGGTPRLHATFVDTASPPGPLTHFPIEPLAPDYAGNPALGQTHPALARAGNRIYLAWRSARILGSTQGEEVWLKEIAWSTPPAGAALELDLSSEEIPLPRWPEHRKGDQVSPALAPTPTGSLVAAWRDHGQTFGTAGRPEVVVELLPLPVLRLAPAGGEGQ